VALNEDPGYVDELYARLDALEATIETRRAAGDWADDEPGRLLGWVADLAAIHSEILRRVRPGRAPQ
jgi:hypothetical protein